MVRNYKEVEIVWPGKTYKVNDVAAKIDCISVIQAPKINCPYSDDALSVKAHLEPRNPQRKWSNMLIHGDNKIVMSALLKGHLRERILTAGGVKLIYIDPPFFAGANFSTTIQVGSNQDQSAEAELEELVYRDTWDYGLGSYLSMIYERLILMRELLAQNGSIWVHCDWKVNFLLRAMLNELFGPEAFRNEIVWYYRNKIPDTRKRQYTNSTDTIYYYARSQYSTFHWQFDKRKKPIKVSRMKKVNGKKVYLKDEHGKGLYDVREYRTADNVWQFPLLHAQPEIVGFPTQKPENLLERIILTASDPGDIVADFFCGSGTTLAVAQKLGRKWIGCDNSPIAVQTTRKRLVQVQRDLVEKGQNTHDFEILCMSPSLKTELGDKSRQSRSVTNDPTFPKSAPWPVNEILSAYGAEPIELLPFFCGRKGDIGVVIVPQDEPVTNEFLVTIIDEASKSPFRKVHIIAKEFDYGLHNVVLRDAAQAGIAMTLKRLYIDAGQGKAGYESGEWTFQDVPYIQFEVRVKDLQVAIALRKVGILGHYNEPECEYVFQSKTHSFVLLCDGRITKLSLSKDGKILRQVLSDKWEDWIDYWAVDFTFGEYAEAATGQCRRCVNSNVQSRLIFREHWQSFRSRKKRGIELVSPPYTYTRSGTHTVAVKIIDILGNEATEVARITI